MACKDRIRQEMGKIEVGKKKVEAMERRAEEFIVKYKEGNNRRGAWKKAGECKGSNRHS